MTVIVLDTGPLGLATQPKRSADAEACRAWMIDLAAKGYRLVVPEIADYELRRELLRAGKRKGLANLDRLAAELDYLPLTTAAMRRAAELWAEARKAGKPTAPQQALDGDVILAAQAIVAFPADAVVATTNVDHLERFVPARLWTDIR